MRIAVLVAVLFSSLVAPSGCDAREGSDAERSKSKAQDPGADRTFDTSVTLPMMAGWAMPTPMVAHGGSIGVLLEAEPAEIQMQLSLFMLAEDEFCGAVVEDNKLLREPTAHKRGNPPMFVEHDSSKPGTNYCVVLSNHGSTETSATMRFAVK